MEGGWRNGVAEGAVAVVVEEETDESVEAAGDLRARSSRKSRPLESGGDVGGEAAVACEHGRSVYLDQEEGIKSLDETNGLGLEELEQLVTNKSLPNCETDCIIEQADDFSAKENHYHCEDLKVKNHEIREEECERTLAGTEARGENIEQLALLQESKVVVEMDLKRILEEQDTHDLYCPNCHSCITKRVILRKRKRTVTVNPSDAKREKLEPFQDDLVSNTLAETADEAHDTEPDVFRCLSCLSFFIPTDTGFRLFHIFGKKEGNENIQSSQQIPGRNKNWLSSLVELMMGKDKRSKLDNIVLDEEKDTISPALGEPTHGIFHAINEEKVDAKGEYHTGSEDSQIFLRSVPKKEAQTNTGEKLASGAENEIARNGSYKVNEVNKVSLYNPLLALGEHIPDEKRNVVVPTEQWPINISDSIGRQVEHLKQDSINHVQVPANNKNSLLETIKIKEGKLHVPKEGIVIISEAGVLKPTQEICLEVPSKSDLNISIPVAPGLQVYDETHIHLEETMAKATKTRQWDVLKAIVYGGLLESVASLSVISSAAGSDVTTLNVVALGLANLVAGLLVVIHNLVELQNEQYKSINGKEEADRYWELLGRRGHFRLHATVALLSYILVGILPPIVYGFSFRKSDNKEYKIIVVAAASLLCITLLAIGKAHVQEGQKTYVKTLLYYIGLGISGSGLSYAVGMLIKKLLEKLALFDDTAVSPSPPLSAILELTSRTPSWWSY